jgi:hypothetical protein
VSRATPSDRIRRAAYAVAELVGTHDHARFLEIVAVVLYADEAANNLDEWHLLLDAEFKRAAVEGAADIRERLQPKVRAAAQRKRAA